MESKYVDSHLDRDFSKGDVHRRVVGGMWDEIGQLQFDYIKAKGHKPSDSLIDIGCGSFRGGTHFIPFLNKGKYFGFDINYKLIEAGLEHEVSQKDRDEKIILDNFISYSHEDPYHYSRSDLKYIAKSSGFKLVKIEDFGHPRNQKMAIFKRL